MMKIISIILYLICSILGLTLMKQGMNITKFNLTVNTINMCFSWKFVIGFLSYIVSFLLWTLIISKYNLSYIYPLITSVLFVLVMVSSALLLKETITTSQIIGTIFIIIGVLITIIKK